MTNIDRRTLVCIENLNPEVMVMEAAEDGARLYASGPLNRANNRRVLVQRPMRSDGVVVSGIGN
jgi:hypothetical protein